MYCGVDRGGQLLPVARAKEDLPMRRKCILTVGTLLTAGGSLACSSSTSTPENVGQVSQAVVPSTGFAVPMRWCVVGDDTNRNGVFDPGEKGVPAFTNPGFVGQPNTDILLWRRHE